MSNAERARTQARARSAREKVLAQRAVARKAERKRRILIASGAISLVAAIAIVLLIVRPGASPTSSASLATGTTAQDAAVAAEIASVPAATFDSVGAGTATGLTATSGQTLLTSAGKPEVLYMGGEFCPYCAAERWALTAALSRFGTFTGLTLIHSSPTDAYPSTPTLSFLDAKYTSEYLDFTPVEWYGEADDASTPFGHVYLQQPTAQETALFNEYGTESFPFVDIGNQYLLPQVQYIPSALQDMTWSAVAAAMRTPTSTVAKDIDGAANILTAAICKMTGGKPGAVCSSTGVAAAAGSL